MKNNNKKIVDNVFFLKLKKIKNNYVLFKRLLSKFILQFNIKIDENKNVYYKNFYENVLLENDKKILSSRNINDLKRFYFILLRKYFQPNNNLERELEFIIKELINSYDIIRWWEFKDKMESIDLDKYFDRKIDKIYFENEFIHRGKKYYPFYNLIDKKYILLFFENIDFDYIKLWENLKQKFKLRNDKNDYKEYIFSYLSIKFDFKIIKENNSIECIMNFFVENEYIHDYRIFFDEIFVTEDGITPQPQKNNKNLINLFNRISFKNIKYINKNKNNIIENIELDNYLLKQKKLELEYLLNINKIKLDRLEKLFRDKIITYEQYLEGLNKIK